MSARKEDQHHRDVCRQTEESRRALEHTRRFLEQLHEADAAGRRRVEEIRESVARDLDRLRSRPEPERLVPGNGARLHPARKEILGSSVYEIDALDRLIRSNDFWDDFARGNGGPAGRIVKGRSLWDSIADEATEEHYRRVVAAARGGRTVTFGIRCDAPEGRRNGRMSVLGLPGGAVRFIHRIEDFEERTAIDPPTRFSDALRNGRLQSCSWCGRFRTGGGTGRWHEIDARVPGAHDLAPAALNQTMCEDCRGRIERELHRDGPDV